MKQVLIDYALILLFILLMGALLGAGLAVIGYHP